MTQDWMDASDEPGRARNAEAIGVAALDDVVAVSGGQFFIKTAFRKAITCILQGVAPCPYRVKPA